MTASEPIPKTGAVTDENGNVDLFGDFGNGAGENGEGNGEQAELLRQKYDEFFTSESDEIEDELIDGESSDSDSDNGGNISPKSFDELVERQKEQKKAAGLEAKDLEPEQQDLKAGDQNFTGFLIEQQNNLQKPQEESKSGTTAAVSPGATGNSSKLQGSDENNSSERRNKYKRDKRASGGPSDAQITPPDNQTHQQ